MGSSTESRCGILHAWKGGIPVCSPREQGGLLRDPKARDRSLSARSSFIGIYCTNPNFAEEVVEQHPIFSLL
jgi:hypothetical protein